ncbi:MAG: hypothetical protein L0177_08835, partial [Chloroflexi bacterium]|nr:hypothetical protein [Chloroflexota bacterium]
YELLTGAHPFAYKSAIEAREAGLTVEQCAELTRGQCKALRGGLSFERDKRTPTIERFLEEFIRGDRPRRSIAMGLVAFLMVFAVLIWWLNGSVIEEWPSPASRGSGVPGGRLSEVKDESTATPRSVQGTVPQRRSQREPPTAQRLTAGGDEVGEALRTRLVPEASSAGPLGEAEVVRSEEGSFVAARRAETVADEAGSSAKKIAADAEDTAPLSNRATALSEKNQRASKLLGLTEAQMATKHLTTPAGGAAYESYQAVLALVPRHRAIKLQDRQVIKALPELKRGQVPNEATHPFQELENRLAQARRSKH